MSKVTMLVVSTLAAGAMGFAVAQAATTTRQAPPAAQTLYAYCDRGGTLSTTTKSGVTGCWKDKGTGQYVVQFNRSIQGCALIGAPGIPSQGNAKGWIVSTTWQQGNAQQAHVATYSHTGGQEAHGFFLAAHC